MWFNRDAKYIFLFPVFFNITHSGFPSNPAKSSESTVNKVLMMILIFFIKIHQSIV